MTDVFTRKKRSEVMSGIQGGLAKNRLERTVHNWLKGSHVKHSMNPKISGWPDAELETLDGKIYIFIDGCFWHVCPLHYRRPKSRRDFWIPHVEDSNSRRESARSRLPYTWMRIWEHQVRDGSYKILLANAISSQNARPKPKGISRRSSPLARR